MENKLMKKIELKICCGMNCLTHGGQELLELAENDSFILKNCLVEGVTCRDSCGDEGGESPVVELNGQKYCKMTSDKLLNLITTFTKTDK
jgi:NADH:ubiquinone oxidoreductase subunit E